MVVVYVLGYIIVVEVIIVVYFCGLVVLQNKVKGVMLVVGVGMDVVMEYLDGKEDCIKIVVINLFGSVMLFGDEDVIEFLLVLFNEEGVFNCVF